MTETTLAITLGYLPDPVCNRVVYSPDDADNIRSLISVLGDAATQRKVMGSINVDIWSEFLPWHSMN
ncbi:MAG: hypothetical protein VKK59_07430 [Vampirovibrionales bacterium]|nr:hypothetical protein [Vampirovibrionales bacterium]